tara:strand:- start:411 stop:590 length:180 start_codon:yes stop_codon:yes gene_type:complete
MAIKEYSLYIVYDDETDNVEYIKEYVSTSDRPAFIDAPDTVEVDKDTWESINTNEIGES